MDRQRRASRCDCARASPVRHRQAVRLQRRSACSSPGTPTWRSTTRPRRGWWWRSSEHHRRADEVRLRRNERRAHRDEGRREQDERLPSLADAREARERGARAHPRRRVGRRARHVLSPGRPPRSPRARRPVAREPPRAHGGSLRDRQATASGAHALVARQLQHTAKPLLAVVERAGARGEWRRDADAGQVEGVRPRGVTGPVLNARGASRRRAAAPRRA